MSHGATLLISIWIAPEDVDEWFRHFKPIFDRVAAEPECRLFEMYQDPEDPGHLSWVEDFNASVEWLREVQLKKEYYKDYRAATEPMYLKPMKIEIVKRVGPPYFVSKDISQA